MEITEVRIKLMDDSQERLQAFCSITIDGCFVVRDLKIIQGTKGSFVAMPSRKLTDRCPRCHSKNHLRAHYCNQCGTKLDEERAVKDTDGRAKLYADIAHPIRCECRDLIQGVVLDAFESELDRAKDPNYVCTYDDYGEDDFEPYDEPAEQKPARPSPDASPQLEPVLAGHRIEPGTNGRPQPPHHAAPREQPASVRQEEDAFGAGIL